MTDPDERPDRAEAGGGGEQDPTPATPLWVKLFGAAFLAVVLIFVILHAMGGGLGRHALP